MDEGPLVAKSKSHSVVKKKPKAKLAGGRRDHAVTAKKKELFLKGLAEGLCVVDAAAAASTNRHMLYRLRKMQTPEGIEFAKAWDDAYDVGTDVLEQEVERRGLKGIDEPVFYQGTQVATKKAYSDNLLMFMTKARRPSKFRESVDMTNSDGSIAKAFAAAVRAANGMDER